MMRTISRGGCLIAAAFSLLMAINIHAHEISAPATTGRWVQAAEAFLAALTPEQRQAAVFAFEDRERFDWHYVPKSRAGLRLKDMNRKQRSLAWALLQAGLSDSGYRKAVNITRLESVLAEIEFGNFMGRDPGKYFVSIFGQPSNNGTWGWRVEGHHLSLNFTIVKGHLVADAPRFLGANPAKVPHGELAGLRTLAAEEDLARELVTSLDAKQQAQAVFSRQAYRDIVTGSDEAVSPLEPVGISADALTPRQKDLLIRLIDAYISNLPPQIARQRLAIIREDKRVRFGWAGGLKPGQPHYYRIQGRGFLIEYDNVQNGANHIHTVWRDFDGDFGRDLLRDHYKAEHR